jgi:CheY-like chemotaxis protein
VLHLNTEDADGGALGVTSLHGHGSVFTLYLPRLAPRAVFTREEAPEEASATVVPEPVASALIDESRPWTKLTPTAPRHEGALALAPTEASSDEVEAACDGPLGERRLLIIDDDVRNIFALTAVLERHGASVLFAEDGRKGIEVLCESPQIDVVLLDIMMPQMDGYETMREIRAHPEFQDLPIIALTAKAMKGDREKCFAAGASDYVTKPVEAPQLIHQIARWCEVDRKKRLDGGS